MLRYRTLLLGALLAGTIGHDAAQVLAADPAKPAIIASADDLDEQQLRRANVPSDTESLLNFLRQRSADKPDPAKIPDFITQLGAKDFKQREEATKALNVSGPGALPALKQAAASEDAEVQKRARQCIQAINAQESDRQTNWALHMPTVRLLVKRAPPEALATLLQYLPHAMGEEAVEEVWYGLDALAVRDGKVDQRLVDALRAKAPERRAVAACIVARRGTPQQRASVRQLLSDKSVEVRLRTAQGMLAVAEKDGLPALIPLLEEAPIDLAWQAEELLHWAAEKTSPKVVLGAGTPEERKQCRQAWEQWWRAEPALDLRKRSESPGPGLLLTVYVRPYEFIPDGQKRPEDMKVPRLRLYGRDGTIRWQSALMPGYQDVHLLSGGRLLVCECAKYDVIDQAGRHSVNNPLAGVTERDLSGKVVWNANSQSNAFKNASRCERLANGNTWIAAAGSAVQEIAPDGARVTTYIDNDIVSWDLKGKSIEWLRGAEKGQWARTRHETLFFRATKQLRDPVLVEFDLVKHPTATLFDPRAKKFRPALKANVHAIIPLHKDLATDPFGVEALPGGNYLIATRELGGRILEYDGSGTVVWDKGVLTLRVVRLRGGTTIACVANKSLKEFDTEGKVVCDIPEMAAILESPTCLNLVRFGFRSGAEQ